MRGGGGVRGCIGILAIVTTMVKLNMAIKGHHGERLMKNWALNSLTLLK